MNLAISQRMKGFTRGGKKFIPENKEGGFPRHVASLLNIYKTILYTRQLPIEDNLVLNIIDKKG